jgi:hypothetical protein
MAVFKDEIKNLLHLSWGNSNRQNSKFQTKNWNLELEILII